MYDLLTGQLGTIGLVIIHTSERQLLRQAGVKQLQKRKKNKTKIVSLIGLKVTK